MKSARLVHFYLGVFFAPLIIFFAFTGTLQVFKLHESYREIPGSQGGRSGFAVPVLQQEDVRAP